MTVLDRLTSPLATWMLTRHLRAADRLHSPKRVRFLRSASRGATVGLLVQALGVCASVLLGLFCACCYATYPASPPEYPASMWVFFGVISILMCLGFTWLGWVYADFRRRLQPFLTPPG